jgi:hypothetical protein
MLSRVCIYFTVPCSILHCPMQYTAAVRYFVSPCNLSVSKGKSVYFARPVAKTKLDDSKAQDFLV